MEWHHIITKPPTCLFGKAIDNYVKFPLAKLVQKSDGSWDWVVFGSNMSGNEPDRTSARIEADKIMNKCSNCGSPLTYYHDTERTRAVCSKKCQGWKVVMEIDHEGGTEYNERTGTEL